MNLTDITEIKNLLSKNGFTFKKSLGQNFLTDSTVCPKMADAATDENSGVIEIGPGAGVLTRELAKRAKKVVAIEIDSRLKPVLNETVGEFSNVEVIFSDVLMLDLSALIKEKFSDCESVSVCANLPYYITSPIIMGLLQSKLDIKSITAMVQLEAANRICADVTSREAGAVTAAVTYYSKPGILFKVPRSSFIPSPNVDSAVIKLEIKKTPPVSVSDEKFFFSLIKCAFAQRRKTFLNSVSNTMGIDKEKLKNALKEIGLDENVRGEKIDLESFAKLSKILK
ncbi:MAG: 16S rRNA (adenine(1518)-N(6)/adenine(1519)-N(6))-dimethyltransferase RsmA [Clostridia bacterium]|nr:16S rRNA (adenine(1518)-N(6)/adenine(1519)-N(6))-dimethyltransferase RsmA [Clostridia bacterium]